MRAVDRALTVRLVDRTGRYVLENEEGEVVANGIAKPSASRPGYVSMLLPARPILLRVPIDWTAALEALPE